MAATNFVNAVTLSDAGWFNDVDAAIYDDVKNLKNSAFGAVGDGTTDDTTAVQAALTIGGNIFAPAGTYLCSSLTVGSNTRIVGAGPGLTIFKIKNTTNDSLFKVSAKSNVEFRDFKINGNSANQNQGNGILVSGASTDIVCENVLIDDYYDWGFNLTQVTRARLLGCGATNGRAGADANSTRAGFLFGTSGGPTNAHNVEALNCYCSGSNNFQNGFMSELGTDQRIIGCRTAVAYTGFKIRGNNVNIEGCYATGGFQGYQTQTSSQNLILKGNIAYRTNESGFFLNNADTVTPARNWIISGNIAVECGQSPASTSYGFAFEGTASATIDQVICSDNLAVDNQGAATQTRGISFGSNGTFSNVVLADNFAKGNTADFVLGTSLQASTLRAWNNGYTSGNAPSAKFSHPGSLAVQTLTWSGTAATSLGLSTNGSTGGRTYLILLSLNVSTGNSAASAVYMVRCGYDGDSNFTATKITGDDGGAGAGSSNYVFSQASGILKVANATSGNNIAAVYMNGI